MGVFTDVWAPIRELLYPVEQFTAHLVPDKIDALLYAIEVEIADLNGRAAQQIFARGAS